jgi:hypothetical protein
MAKQMFRGADLGGRIFFQTTAADKEALLSLAREARMSMADYFRLMIKAELRKAARGTEVKECHT